MACTVRAFALAAAVALTAAAAPASAAAERRARGPSEPMALGELEPQKLQPGRCGMFLWTLGAEPRFVGAAFDDPTEIVLKLNGDEMVIRRIQFGGQARTGHFERQRYKLRNLQVDVDVTFDDSRPIRDGVLVKAGAIRITDKNGWETLAPVAGMTACDRNPKKR